jgi:hypothetical protein
MRVLPVLALSAATLFLAGCSDVLSTEPLAIDDDTVFDAGSVGTWFDQDDTVITVTSAQPPVYEILTIGTNEGDKHQLRGRLVQFGEQRILDVTDVNPGIYSIQGHVWIYVQKKGKGIQIQYLHSKWFQEKVRQSGLAFFLADKHPVITAPTAKLREFVGKYGVQPEARGKALELVPLGKKQP